MKIYSKEHDYYDIGLQYGIDSDIKFIRRNNVEISVKDDRLSNDNVNILYNLKKRINFGSHISRDYEVFSYVVLFCGKVYPLFEINNTFFTSIDGIENFLISIKSNKRIMNTWNRKDKIAYWLPNFSKRNLQELFDYCSSLKVDDIHHELETPIILITEKSYTINLTDSVIINPILKDVEFYKIFDPYQTYQEISMYIGGILGGQSPKMIEVSDDVRIHKHGFDKQSFRTRKKKKA